jgi:hypothetical protein
MRSVHARAEKTIGILSTYRRVAGRGLATLPASTHFRIVIMTSVAKTEQLVP